MPLHLPARDAAGDRTLVLDRISKRFGQLSALYETTLSVQSGELVSLLGPSGCGKTTTLRIIAGLETTATGRILIGGQDVTALPPDRRQLGMVFQNYRLFPHLTVGENIGFGLKMRRLPRPEVARRVADILAMVRLPEYGERYAAQLSGGQQQRVALARALVTDPRILLLDEPLGALDKNLREGMQFELRQLQRRLGMTTILVTHDQEEALTMSDRVVVMNAGRILQVGPPEDIYDRPRTRFVAEFLGTANILDAAVDRLQGREASIVIRRDRAAGIRVAGPLPCPVASSAIRIALRPEKLAVVSPDTAGDGVVQAEVVEHVFRGQIHAYQLSVQGIERKLVAYAPPGAGRAYGPGDTVGIRFDGSSCIPLEDDGAA